MSTPLVRKCIDCPASMLWGSAACSDRSAELLLGCAVLRATAAGALPASMQATHRATGLRSPAGLSCAPAAAASLPTYLAASASVHSCVGSMRALLCVLALALVVVAPQQAAAACGMDPPAVTNNEWPNTCRNLSSGVCTGRCNDGYELGGPPTATCQASGMWTTPVGTCIKGAASTRPEVLLLVLCACYVLSQPPAVCRLLW